LQAIVAAGVGGLAFFRRSIGGFFRRFRRHEPPDDRTEPQAPEE
jgi:hypothetical protein